jgi:hypothetical protein
MNVAQLIDILEQFPMDMEIIVYDEYRTMYGEPDITEVGPFASGKLSVHLMN